MRRGITPASSCLGAGRVLLEGNLAVVDPPGDIFVFERGAQGWTQTATIDAGPLGRDYPISVDNGAIFMRRYNPSSGTACERADWVLRKVSGQWREVATIGAPQLWRTGCNSRPTSTMAARSSSTSRLTSRRRSRRPRCSPIRAPRVGRAWRSLPAPQAATLRTERHDHEQLGEPGRELPVPQHRRQQLGIPWPTQDPEVELRAYRLAAGFAVTHCSPRALEVDYELPELDRSFR